MKPKTDQVQNKTFSWQSKFWLKQTGFENSIWSKSSTGSGKKCKYTIEKPCKV